MHKKLISLVLAAALLAAPLPQVQLYAAEAAETQSDTQDAAEPESETETENDAQSTEEPEADTELATEADTELMTEADTELTTEADTEPATEAESEDGAETVTETAPEIENDYDYPCPGALEPENTPYDENQDAFTDKLVRRARSTFPAKYDAREEDGGLPAVRNQGSWGACWSFSLLGAMEVSAIRDIGIAADEIDLSERHLAYFGFNTGYDALGNAGSDTMTAEPAEYYLKNGGNDIRGVVRLMNWNGGAGEAEYPYVTGSLPADLKRETAQDAKVYLENAHRYNFAAAIADDTGAVDAEKKEAAIKVVKQMIMDYGAVSWSYYIDAKYANDLTGAYYNDVGGSKTEKTNHAVMAVGWDDSYPKENFREDRQPQNNGAWIIRNSYGENRGDGGYYYISYEDVSLGSGNPVYAFTVCGVSKYDNNYFYGNTAFSSTTIAVRRAAQVFRIKNEHAVREKLTAVSFLIGTSDVDYELQIYKNPDMENGVVANPASGTAMLDTPQKGKTSYAGLHTITLEKPVTLDTDDYVSIVLTFPNTKPSMYFDRSYTSDGGNEKGVHHIAKGRSFYSSDLTSWSDNYNDNRTFRINALTVNCEDIEETPEIKKTDVIESQGFDQLPQILIQWSKCTDVQEYRIYRSEDGGQYELIHTADHSTRAYTDTIPERKPCRYYYKVEAVYSGKTEMSDAVSQTVKGVIDVPKLTLSSYDGYHAVFTWNEISGAEHYELWKISDKGSEDAAERIADLTAAGECAYTIDTDGWELGNYFYKIRAVCGDLQTAWSGACINRNLTWKQNSYYRAYFEWLPIEGAASYKLFHRVNGKAFSATLQKTSAVISMKSDSYRPCDRHEYYIKAYDEAGNEVGAGTSSTIAFEMTPDALSIDSIEYDYAKTAAITWSGGLGAEKVMVYRTKNPLEQGELTAELAKDAAADANGEIYHDTVSKGKTYWYRFVPIAVNTSGDLVEGQTAVSDKVLTHTEPAALDEAQYTGENGVRLAWNAAKGAEGYLVERSDNQNAYAVLAAVEGGDAVTYTDKSVEAGNSYQYRVRSYFTSESGSRESVPTARVFTVDILPEPVGFSAVTELKRDAADKQNNRTRVALSWDAQGNGQSYAVYRSIASDSAPNAYACIAQQITEGHYTDNTAVPGMTYRYKLAAISNGLESDLEQTQAGTITLKPALTALEMPAEHMEIIQDTGQAFKITPKPEHYPYKEELVWSAYDEEKNALEITQKNDTLVINGTDGKEILYIADDGIHAVCASETVRITLAAAIDEIRAECSIFVYHNDFWVSGVKNYTYTGGAITQNLEVYNGNTLLTEGVDYTAAYKNNVKVSVNETDKARKPAVLVKGKGNYAGTQTIYFEILPEPESDAGKIPLIKANVKSIKTVQYQGTAIEPKPIVKIGGKTLAEGTDYTLSYENNQSAGKAAVIINGINGYKGTKKVSFTVNYDIQKDEANLMRVTPDAQDAPYAKGGAKPDLQVYCGSTLLVEGTDYQISYKNNKAVAAASGKKAPTAVITGRGNYKGKIETAFNIVPQDIGALTLTAGDKVYTEKAGGFATSFAITDKDGKKLSAGKDYDKKSVVYTYAETGEPVGKTDLVPQGTKLCITVNATETGAYRGSISGVYRITAYDIRNAKASVEPQTYTGSAIEPHSGTGVKVTYKGCAAELTEGVDYEITGYENNHKTGTAKLYIKGLGDFGGIKTVNFKIRTKIFQWWGK